jgi:hypothetical protein
LEEFTKQEMRINMRLLVSDKQQQLTQQAVQATRAVIYMAERICLEFNNDQLPAECRLKFTKQHRIAKESLEKQLRRQLLEVFSCTVFIMLNNFPKEQEREGEQRRKQKQQERQAEIDKLPREARRKLEEKESKREAKKLMQRRAKQIK